METQLTTFAGPFAVDTASNLSKMFSSESTIPNSLVSASTRVRILLRSKKLHHALILASISITFSSCSVTKQTADTLVMESISGHHGPSGPMNLERKLMQCGSLWGGLEVGFLAAEAKL